MLDQLFSNPVIFLIWALTIIIAITVHEFAHAFAADRLGDPTPRSQDRLTLNPKAHLDPIGTILILFAGFGWGKPVMFDPYNLRNPKRDAAIIALAGPISNLILATLFAFIFKLFLPIELFHLIGAVVYINVMLAIFNLVPVFPLDGEKILYGLLPGDIAEEYNSIMRQYGTLILILLIVPFGGSSAISSLIGPIINSLVNLIL